MIPQQTFESFPVFSDTGTKVKPDDAKYSAGFQVNDVLPAEWMNWEWNKASKGVSDLNRGLDSVEKEIHSVLSSFGITPAEATNNQLLTALRLSSTFLSASSTTITGPLLVSGGTIRVLFTAAIAGSDTATGLTISYNGQNISVKVYKDGVLSDFTAAKISWEDASAVYRYLDAGTTLELLYNGSYFIIVNNPAVLKSIRYTIYADGTVAGGHVGLTAISFSETLDYGWLACEHQNLLRADYPRLFNYWSTHKIGSSTLLDIFGYADSTHFYLPDTREAALVGAGQNDSDTIATHDVYTVGEFKDDQIQTHGHNTATSYPGSAPSAYGLVVGGTGTAYTRSLIDNYINDGRSGSVTRGKRKGVKYIIKVL